MCLVACSENETYVSRNVFRRYRPPTPGRGYRVWPARVALPRRGPSGDGLPRPVGGHEEPAPVECAPRGGPGCTNYAFPAARGGGRRSEFGEGANGSGAHERFVGPRLFKAVCRSHGAEGANVRPAVGARAGAFGSGTFRGSAARILSRLGGPPTNRGAT